MPNDENSTPDTQRHRPRACGNCARSKMKCQWLTTPGSQSCQRCLRLQVECTLPELTIRKRRGPSTRINQLEDKLDGLISILHNPGGSTPYLLSSETPPSFELIPDRHINVVAGFSVDLKQADDALDLYRASFQCNFPFVPLARTATAADLFETEPFLLRTILVIVLPQTASLQRAVSRWFREYLAQTMIVKMERRLELLRAILVFLSWGDFQFYLGHTVTDLFQLAVVLAVDLDLGLDKGLAQPGARSSFLPDAIRQSKIHRKKGSDSLDNIRALLGLSYLNSIVTTLFHKMPEFGYSSATERYCDSLAKAREHNSDQLLVSLVRIQQLITRVSASLVHLGQGQGGLEIPAFMAVAIARKELDAFVESVPVDTKDVIFSVLYNGALIKLYEYAIFLRPTPSSHGILESSRRTEALSSCLQAVRDFFAAHASIPADRLNAMPLPVSGYMAFAFVTASRIVVLDDADWSAQLARAAFDFGAACQTMADRLEEADAVAQTAKRRRRFEEEGDQSVLHAYSIKVKWIRQWYLTKVSGSSRPASQGQPDMPMDEDALMPNPASVFEELDEDFWNVIFCSGGTQDV